MKTIWQFTKFILPTKKKKIQDLCFHKMERKRTLYILLYKGKMSPQGTRPKCSFLLVFMLKINLQHTLYPQLELIVLPVPAFH